MDLRRRIESSSTVVASVGHLIKPLIGPRRSVKCIESCEGCRYTRDPVVLLQLLDIQHPVGQYVVSVCQGFIEQYKTGGDNLLYFICSWTRAATLLCDMGIPCSTVIDILRVALTDCITHIGALKLTLNEAVGKLAESKTHHAVPEVDPCIEDLVGMDCLHYTDIGNADFVPRQNSTSSFNQSSKTCNDGTGERNVEKENDNEHATDSSRYKEQVEESNGVNLVNISEEERVAGECETWQRVENFNKYGNPLSDLPFQSNSSVTETVCSSEDNALKRSEVSFSCGQLQLIKDDDDAFLDDDVSWFFQDRSGDSSVQVHSSVDVNFNKDLTDHGDEAGEHSTIKHAYTENLNQHIDMHQITRSCTRNGNDDTLVVDFATDSTERGRKENDGGKDGSNSETYLIEELEDLKTGIEADLKLVKDFKAKQAERKNPKKTGSSLKDTHPFIDLENDDDSDSEFDTCFQSNIFKTDACDVGTVSGTDASDEFCTIQIVFNSNAQKVTDTKMISNSNNKSANHFSTTAIDELKLENKFSPVKLDTSQASLNKHQFAFCTELANCISEHDMLCTVTKNNTICKLEDLGDGCSEDEPYPNNTISSKPSIEQDKHASRESKFKVDTNVENEADNHCSSVCDKDEKVVTLNGCDKSCRDNDIKHQAAISNCDNTSASESSEKTGTNFHDPEVEHTILKMSEGLNNVSQLNSLLTMLGNSNTKLSCTSALSKSRHFKSFTNSCKETGVSSAESEHLVGQVSCIGRDETMCKEETTAAAVVGDTRKSTSDVSGTNDGYIATVHGCEAAATHGTPKVRCKKIGCGKGDNLQCGTANASSTSMLQLPIENDQCKPSMKIDRNKTNFSRASVFIRHINEIEKNDEQCTNQQIFAMLGSNHGCNPDGGVNSRECHTEEMEKRNTRKAGRQLAARLSYMESRKVSDLVQTIVERCAVQIDGRYNLPHVSSYRSCGQQELSVVEGVIINTSVANMAAVQQLSHKHCRALFVNGDVTPTYRHKGYKPIKSTTIFSAESFSSHVTKNDQWLMEIASLLKKLHVDVILARGSVSPEITDICNALNIVAIEAVPYKQLVVLSEAAHVDLLTYVTLATEVHICKEIHLSPWGVDWGDTVVTEHETVGVVVSMATNNPVTVVLCDLTPDLLDLREQEFWECYHRVMSVYKSGFVLPGQGHTEIACAQYCRHKTDYLQSIPDKRDQDHLLPTVYETLQASFLEYSQLLKQHSTDDTDPVAATMDCFFDDYTSKTEGWKVAIDTVCTILNSDCYIISGITDDQLVGTNILTL